MTTTSWDRGKRSSPGYGAAVLPTLPTEVLEHIVSYAAAPDDATLGRFAQASRAARDVALSFASSRDEQRCCDDPITRQELLWYLDRFLVTPAATMNMSGKLPATVAGGAVRNAPPDDPILSRGVNEVKWVQTGRAGAAYAITLSWGHDSRYHAGQTGYRRWFDASVAGVVSVRSVAARRDSDVHLDWYDAPDGNGAAYIVGFNPLTSFATGDDVALVWRVLIDTLRRARAVLVRVDPRLDAMLDADGLPSTMDERAAAEPHRTPDVVFQPHLWNAVLWRRAHTTCHAAGLARLDVRRRCVALRAAQFIETSLARDPNTTEVHDLRKTCAAWIRPYAAPGVGAICDA